MGLKYKGFRDINHNDPFFCSLKEDYAEFEQWFEQKSLANDSAYVFYHNSEIVGFLYLKLEEDLVDDVDPPLAKARRVKVGTFKIHAHGTRLGERFIKITLDWAFKHEINEAYVTIFDKHKSLVELFEKYGFVKVAEKKTTNGVEGVYLKSFDKRLDDILKNYPRITMNGHRKYLLAIDPKFHTRLFPDSILNTESESVITDVAHTNSIHKVYLCKMRNVENLRAGDIIVIYRKGEENTKKEYTSVVTSICVCEEYRNIDTFENKESFLKYCKPYSVFTEADLEQYWRTNSYPKIIRFSYNFKLNKRPNRHALINKVGIDRNAYPGFMELDSEQLCAILKLGEINESLIVDQA